MVQTLSAETTIKLLFALVMLIISEVHQIVDQNAQSTQNVRFKKRVTSSNVEILAKELVALMLNAKLSIITQFVVVQTSIQEIRLCAVI